MNLSNLKNKLKKLPASPGVYIFYDKNRKILYMGKATSLKDRVESYFVGNAHVRSLRGMRPIEMMISEVTDLKIKKTETVLEAYILEQELIKKLQPKYNVDGKDDKSFSYIAVAKEEFPRFMILRKTDLENGLDKSSLYKKIYGPYTSKKQIEIALKILRKIFPYHSRKEKTEKGCLDFQIGLCPGPYAGEISKRDYAKNIRGIKMVLEGKKKNLLARMKREMEKYSHEEKFEKAARMRNQIFALQHVRDMALISYGNEKFQIPNSKSQIISNIKYPISKPFRIEGYDISNISGKYNVGSMVVFDNMEDVGNKNFCSLRPNKSQYRKFKIKTIKGVNDVAAMKEVLSRRFRNNWERPNLILLDGGAGQLTAARQVLKMYKLEIPILAVAKGPKRKKLDRRSFGSVPELPDKIIEQIRDEAHRFAIRYHRKLRDSKLQK